MHVSCTWLEVDSNKTDAACLIPPKVQIGAVTTEGRHRAREPLAIIVKRRSHLEGNTEMPASCCQWQTDLTAAGCDIAAVDEMPLRRWIRGAASREKESVLAQGVHLLQVEAFGVKKPRLADGMHTLPWSMRSCDQCRSNLAFFDRLLFSSTALWCKPANLPLM
eukprot:165780-Pelagomonas_calceolata.AAC.2